MRSKDIGFAYRNDQAEQVRLGFLGPNQKKFKFFEMSGFKILIER